MAEPGACHEIDSQFCEAIRIVIGEAILNRQILAFDQACIHQALVVAQRCGAR